MFNQEPIPISVQLPYLAKAVQEQERRVIYFEASRDNVVDREGEIVALEALWASRELFLSQGNFDIAHWAWLPNPLTGRPDPGYVIGMPTDVKRQGGSLYVRGEVFSNRLPPPEGAQGDWANKFWHSITGQNPPSRWFPSVYGNIKPGGVEMTTIKGQKVRRITNVEWYSVGFALRAQHPDLPAVSTQPMGGLAKADQGVISKAMAQQGVLQLSWGNFAKAVSAVGLPQTDHASLTGVQALRKESVDPRMRQASALPGIDSQIRRIAVLRQVKKGTVPLEKALLAKAFEAAGATPREAQEETRDLLRDLQA